MDRFEEPVWICGECGLVHGQRPAGICAWHPGICDLCDREEMVTSVGNFGNLKENWRTAVAVMRKDGSG